MKPKGSGPSRITVQPSCLSRAKSSSDNSWLDWFVSRVIFPTRLTRMNLGRTAYRCALFDLSGAEGLHDLCLDDSDVEGDGSFGPAAIECEASDALLLHRKHGLHKNYDRLQQAQW